MQHRPFVVFLSLLLATSLLAPAAHAQSAPAQFDPRPPSGIGGIVVGAAGFGIAGLNLATLPICFADFYVGDEAVCAGVSAVFVVGGLAAGIPGLVIGKRRRAVYKEWRARQRARTALLEGLRLDAAPGRAGLAFGGRF